VVGGLFVGVVGVLMCPSCRRVRLSLLIEYGELS